MKANTTIPLVSLKILLLLLVCITSPIVLVTAECNPPCLNGGACVTTAVTSICDCTGFFAGDHCQYPATHICHATGTKEEILAQAAQTGEQPSFCVNNGSCADIIYEGAVTHVGCICPLVPDGRPAFLGSRCEHEVLFPSATPSASPITPPSPHPTQSPTVSPSSQPTQSPSVVNKGCASPYGLQCEHGGTCIDMPPEAIDFPPLYLWDKQDLEMSCICPHGWGGLLCEMEKEPCEFMPSISCYNKAKCAETTLPSGDIDLSCNCTTPEGIAVAAGAYCEHPATDICYDMDNPESEIKVESFCTNKGLCIEKHTSPDGPTEHKGCTCPIGFVGDFCQDRDIVNVPVLPDPTESPTSAPIAASERPSMSPSWISDSDLPTYIPDTDMPSTSLLEPPGATGMPSMTATRNENESEEKEGLSKETVEIATIIIGFVLSIVIAVTITVKVMQRKQKEYREKSKILSHDLSLSMEANGSDTLSPNNSKDDQDKVANFFDEKGYTGDII